jgi:hypothetical protein
LKIPLSVEDELGSLWLFLEDRRNNADSSSQMHFHAATGMISCRSYGAWRLMGLVAINMALLWSFENAGLKLQRSAMFIVAGEKNPKLRRSGIVPSQPGNGIRDSSSCAA